MTSGFEVPAAVLRWTYCCIACVGTDGVRLAEPRRLTVKLEKIESVYSYKRRDDGSTTWDCERVRSTMMEGMQVESSVDSDTQISIPVKECGDYAITVCDSESDVSFGTTFYIGDNDDSEVRASLSNPVKVSLTADKPFYRVGEKPRILVKSPFAGTALLTVLRDGVEYSEVLTLTNATSEVTLRETVDKWAPNVDVAISVVQSVVGQHHLAARAHGETTIRVRPAEREIAVSVKPSCDVSARKVSADITAAGARFLTVTLVDEGINLLTGEPTPDPIARFAEPRTADRPLFVQALHYTWEDLEFARHRGGQERIFNLPSPRPEVFLNLDIGQCGLGGASCGPRPMDKYLLPPKPEAWTLRLEPLT